MLYFKDIMNIPTAVKSSGEEHEEVKSGEEVQTEKTTQTLYQFFAKLINFFKQKLSFKFQILIRSVSK